MPDVLHFSIPGKAEYVRTVRMAVSCLANSIGFDIEAIEDIKVAVSEACTNVVCHSRDEEKLYDVYCEVDFGKITVSVIDKGVGYDQESYKSPCLNNPQEGGLGLYIIHCLMDEVFIDSERGNGTNIKMVKYAR